MGERERETQRHRDTEREPHTHLPRERHTERQRSLSVLYCLKQHVQQPEPELRTGSSTLEDSHAWHLSQLSLYTRPIGICLLSRPESCHICICPPGPPRACSALVAWSFFWYLIFSWLAAVPIDEIDEIDERCAGKGGAENCAGEGVGCRFSLWRTGCSKPVTACGAGCMPLSAEPEVGGSSVEGGGGGGATEWAKGWYGAPGMTSIRSDNWSALYVPLGPVVPLCTPPNRAAPGTLVAGKCSGLMGTV
jgi:hypothetical protein